MALPLERLLLIKSRDKIWLDSPDTYVLGLSGLSVIPLAFCASSRTNHDTLFGCACDSSDFPDFSSGHSSFYNPSVVVILSIVAVPAQFLDPLFFELDNDRRNDSNSSLDRLVVHSTRLHGSHSSLTHVARLLWQFFFDNILQYFMF